MGNLSSKFVGTMVVLILSYALVWAGKLDAKVWLDLAVVGVGLYSAANVVEKRIQK